MLLYIKGFLGLKLLFRGNLLRQHPDERYFAFIGNHNYLSLSHLQKKYINEPTDQPIDKPKNCVVLSFKIRVSSR